MNNQNQKSANQSNKDSKGMQAPSQKNQERSAGSKTQNQQSGKMQKDTDQSRGR